MTRKKQVYLFLLSLSMMILIGCGKSTSETKEVTDGSVVVQVPEGSTVESLFDFTSTENISLSGATSGIIHVGNLENGNSVVWRSDSYITRTGLMMIRFPIVNLKNSLGLMFDKQEENQMTYVRIGGSSFSNEDIFAFVVVILVIGIASWIGYFILKSKDNSKPLEKAKVKILEKPVQKGNIEWYVVEFENGERKKLRSFHADTIFIAVGDEGILEYRGITIQAFHPLTAKK